MTQQTDFLAYVQALSGELAPQGTTATSTATSTAAAPKAPPSGQAIPWGASDVERRLGQAIAQAVKAWNASGEGQALKSRLAGASMDDIRHAVAQILASPTFAPVQALVQEHARVQQKDRSLEIRAISLGLEFMVDFIVGIQGSVGVAVPPQDWTNEQEYVVYLSGSLEEGVDETAFVGVALGLWNINPTDLGGTSWGLEGELGFIDEVVVEASFGNSALTDFIGLTFADGVGEGGGGEAVESYTLVWNWDAPHVYQPPQPNYMIVQSIVCDKAGEMGGDEIYFKFTPNGGNTYRYPTRGRFSLNDGQTWNAGRSIYFKDSVLVELFDQDDTNDDPRGSYTYTATNFPYNKTLPSDDGQYQINAVLNPVFAAWPTSQQINNDSDSSGPTACGFLGRLYYFWQSGDNRLYFSASADGTAWPAGAPINSVDNSPQAPTAIDFGGELFVFWRGGNNGVYWSSSTTGQAPWPNGVQIGSSATSAAPTPCIFNDQLYLFWNDTGSPHRIVFSIFNAQSRSWSASQQINGTDSSGDRLAACEFQGQLHVFWRTNDGGSNANKIFYARSASGTTNSWPNGQNLNASEYTKAAPAVNVYQGNLFVFFVTNNSYADLVWVASATGTSWPANTPTGKGGLQGLPTVTNYKNSQCLAWTQNGHMWFSPSSS